MEAIMDINTTGGLLGAVMGLRFSPSGNNSFGLAKAGTVWNHFQGGATSTFNVGVGFIGLDTSSLNGNGAHTINAPFAIGHITRNPVLSPGAIFNFTQYTGGYDCEAHTRPSPVNFAYRYTAQSGGTANYGIWGNSNTASCAAGWVTGTAGDTCRFRGRAGAWEDPNATDSYTLGFYCAGPGCTSTVPAASSVGVYDSAVRVCSSVSCTGCTSATLTNGALALVIPAGTTYTGTANQITVTGTVLSLPSAVILPGSIVSPTGYFLNTAAPTLNAFGGAACTGGVTAPTVSFLGNSGVYTAQVTTGNGACLGSNSAIITIQNPTYGRCTVSPANAATGAIHYLAGIYIAEDVSFLRQTISVSTVSVLTASTPYKWVFTCTGAGS